MPARDTFHSLILKNKRNSLLLMTAAVALLLILGVAIGEVWFGEPIGGLLLAGFAALVVVIFSWFGGGDLVLLVSQAKPIEKREHPQLFNVVEELSIAAGIPMPRIYIIEDTAPNAFATGRDPTDATVAITRGLLEKLDRDELQGVMAHELSHIRNYDIRFAMLMTVLVGMIVLLADFFLRGTFWGVGRRRSSNDHGHWIVVLLAMLLAILAPLLASLIQMAMSRQREYLADASAIELTRYPDGLASALRKISDDEEPLEAANRATQHLYIVNPLEKFKQGADSLMSTHPPLEERINRLRQLTGQNHR
ncbi:MAG: zinc metalloprotease HtpX [bacterium]|nr:zinc metalloprotease HtpX [bacterium]